MQYEAIPPMEPAHRPRPFGCGLRVTLNSVPTRTVVDPGRGIFNLCYGGRNHHERFSGEADSAALDCTTIQKARPH